MTIETKFSPRGMVWTMKDNKPAEIYINEVRVVYADSGIHSIYYVSGGICFDESKVFATKDELRKHLFGK